MRAEKVKAAWSEAYRRIAAVYDVSGVTIDTVRAYSPAIAQAIDEAQTEAEDASARWAGGGPGPVQSKIDAWVALWLEGIDAVRAAV